MVSTLTFAAVFLPTIFLSGMARYLFAPLAWAATFVIVASLIVAVTVVPSFCARFLETGEGGASDESRWQRRYSDAISSAIRRRWVVLTAAALAAVAAGLLLVQTGTELFPRVDAAQLQIYVRMPSGTRIERTERLLAGVEGAVIDELGEPDPEFPTLEQHPESDLRMLITNIGVLMDWPAAYTPNTGPMDAFMLLQLKEGRRSIFEVVETLRRKLRQQFPQAEFAFDTGGMLTAALNFGEPAPIHFQVKGSDLVVLETLGHEIARLLVGVDGAADVRVAQRNDYPTLEIDIDRTKAALAGLTTEDVMHNLITATNSSINFMPSFWIDPRNGNHYFIGAQYPESEHVSADTLLDIPLTPSGGGATVPLRTVATLERGTGPSFVSHRNITRVVDVYADVAPGANLGQVVSRMEEALFESAELALEPFVDERGNVSFQVGGEYAGRGYTLSASGEIQSMRTSFKQFARGFVLALVLIYLLLVAQLRSFIDPLMILLTVPLGFIGVSLVLFATGTSLNIQSLMGIIMMAGIVVEYGIILVHFANERVEQGQPIVEAVKEAARVRLRPILMTSLTTALALLPMALGIAGAEANMPLARTIIGGVLGAMVLTLFVLPCLYVWMKRPLKPREQDEELDAVTGEPTHV
jgi:multidrug efflux pump subunit AcrB